MILNQPFTLVNTGSVRYILTLANGEIINRDKGECQGIYMEVYGNKTTIKGRDFKRKQWAFTQEISK